MNHVGPSGLTPSLPLRVLTSLPRPDGRGLLHLGASRLTNPVATLTPV